jgi:WD40 repeat protein
MRSPASLGIVQVQAESSQPPPKGAPEADRAEPGKSGGVAELTATAVNHTIIVIVVGVAFADIRLACKICFLLAGRRPLVSETNPKQEISQAENGITREPATRLVQVVERACSLAGAQGAAIAVREPQGVVCLASTGSAPAVGSRLQPNSAFTQECLETGQVVLCEDAESDSRIHPFIARSLDLRSAVAVPIRAHGSILGVIEVFSSRPCAFDSTHIDALQGIAKSLSFAPVAASAPGGNLVAADAVSGQTEAHPETEGRTAVYPSLLTWPPKHLVKTLQPAIGGGFVSTAVAARFLRRFAAKNAAPQRWLAGAAGLCLVAAVFLLAGSHLQPTKTSSATSIRAASGVARPGALAVGATGGKAPATVNEQDLKGAAPPSGNGVVASTSSSSEQVKDRPGRSGFSKLSSVPVLPGQAVASNHAPQADADGVAVPPDSNREQASAFEQAGQTFSVAARLEPFELPLSTPPTAPALLAVAPAIPALVERTSTSPPVFLLDHTLKGHSGWVTGVAFSSDGQRLASGSWDQTVKFWDVHTGQAVSTVASKMKEVQALAFSRDGHWLAAENASDAVTVWDATTGREIRTLPSNKPLGVLGSNWVYSIAFSPDGQWLASGVDDKTVRLWEVKTGRALRDLTALRRSVIYAAFSPDGRLLASGNDDKSIRIWEASSGQEIVRLSGHKKPIYAVAFSPDGHCLASGGADKTIKLWDVAAGRELRTLTGHGSVVTSLSFSPDGRWLASGSWDKTIKIWDAETGRQIETLVGDGHSVYTVAFDSQGRWLASGSEDGTIRLWRLSESGVQTRLR